MFIKYSPVKFNEFAGLQSNPNTQIIWVNEDTVNIDGEDYEFDKDSVIFPDIAKDTDFLILDAYRNEAGILHLTVRRFYTDNCEWDTGDYHENNR